MVQNNKSATAILAGVIILAAAVSLFVYLSQDAGHNVSDHASPALEDASRTADGAAIERGQGAQGRRDLASGRLLAGAESDEEAPDEEASDVAQKKKGKKKRRQRRGQDAESTEEDASGAPNNAELPPASILEGDH